MIESEEYSCTINDALEYNDDIYCSNASYYNLSLNKSLLIYIIYIKRRINICDICNICDISDESEIQFSAYEQTQILLTKAKFSSAAYERMQILLTKAELSSVRSA